MENSLIKTGQIKDYLFLAKVISKSEINYLIDKSYTQNDLILTFYLENKPILGLIFCVEPENDKIALIYNFASIDKKFLKLYGLFFLMKAINNILSKNKFSEIEFYFSESNTPFFENIMEILEASNFKKTQTKLKLILETRKKSDFENFDFKSINLVGEETFIRTLRKISSNSLDNEDIEYHKKYGSKKSSIEYFKELKSQNFIPNLWELAFWKNKLVGLIISQIENKDTGSISYIGIIPKMRGNRFIDELILHSIEKLKNKKRIIAETDFCNNPMIKAFSRNGFVVYDKIHLFKKKLI